MFISALEQTKNDDNDKLNKKLYLNLTVERKKLKYGRNIQRSSRADSLFDFIYFKINVFFDILRTRYLRFQLFMIKMQQLKPLRLPSVS